MTDEFEINRARYAKMLEARKPFKKIFGKIELETVPIFENPVCYDMEDLVALENQMYTILYRGDVAEHPEWVEEYQRLASAMKPLPNAPKPIDLWPEGKVPTLTDYPDNNEYLFNHDPDFRPYLHEMLLPEYEKPKGAAATTAGARWLIPSSPRATLTAWAISASCCITAAIRIPGAKRTAVRTLPARCAMSAQMPKSIASVRIRSRMLASPTALLRAKTASTITPERRG